MDAYLAQFLSVNKVSLLLTVFLLLPIIPTTWLGTDAMYNDNGVDKKRVKFNLVSVFFQLIIQPINQILFNLSILFNFKTTISLLIFVVIGIELYFKKQVSQQSVMLVGISITVLYLEQLIEKAKKISIWKFFEWESK